MVIWGGGGRKCDTMVREKRILVREKSVKSQGTSFQTKSGHPGMGNVHKHKFTFTKENLLDHFLPSFREIY